MTDIAIRASGLNVNIEPSGITVEIQMRIAIAISTAGYLGVDRRVTVSDNFTPAGIYHAVRELHGRATL